MTSSLHSGERRWASSRKSGMTVLGKVAVPKPINLPSQRLENHGLDPNVEIVPKGTLSWGSKSSSSSNAWGSSTLSPNTDGSSGSSSHLSARPSSGGSGTRPSTAASDRAQEPPSAWGSNSRPSSASGSVTSNQAPFASLRPRSAETRPGSSQLSRFAEPASESQGAWGAAGTAERLGISSSKNDGFSLASGDFPTLGSEKETTGKTTARQDHRSLSRPGSSSGEVDTVKEKIGDVSASTHLRSGNADSWRRDNPAYPEDGVRPSMEKWHADPQGPHPFPNSSIPPQHYGGWHGPPINNHPGSGWYRGPPGNLPYGSPVPPGGFPLDPIHYYQPHIPGPQPVPPPGVGPRGNYSNKGDMYRPPMTDAYVRPGMPMRPGFYPTPVPYDGYYGPPIGYCNSNERDMQFIGMPAGPAAYNRFHGPNAPDMGGSHARVGGYGPSGKPLASEHVESGHPHDARGPYKVLLKQHDGRESNKEQKWADIVDKDDQQMAALLESERKAVHRNEEMNLRRTVVEEAPHSIDQCRGGPVSMNVLPKGVENSNVFDRMCGSVITNSGSNEASRSQDPIAASGAVNPRRSSHGLHGRADHGEKGRFNSQETDLRGKKPTVMDSLRAKPAVDPENPNSNAKHHSSGAGEISEQPQAREPTCDPNDSQAQHAKMELAKQRMKQRQEEEEERERDQKARALAKLEELNKRRQAVESSAQKLVAESASANKPEESHFLQEGSKPLGEYEVSGSAAVSKSNVVAHVGNSIIRDGESTVLSVEQPPESTSNANRETSEKDIQSLSLHKGDNKAHPPDHNKPQQVADCSLPKQKHASYRPKHNVPLEKSSTEKSVSGGTTEVYFGQINTAVNVSSAKVVAAETVSNTDLNSARSIMNGPLTPQRRENGRNDRNKQKVDEASSMASLPSGTSSETNIANNFVEDGKAKSSDSDCDPLLVHPQNDSKETNHTLEKHSSSPNEDFHGRVNNKQRKPQQSRQAARNQQAQISAEKFYNNDAVFWAPVKSHNRNEVAEQVNQKPNVEAGDSSVKSNPQLQNVQRNKRAEMERYVVKPVSKDIAQHGSGQQRVPTSDNRPSVRVTDYGAQETETTTDLRSGDGKQNRQGKGQGSSRQRTSTEQTTQSMPDSQSSISNKKKSTGHLEDKKIDSNLVKEHPKHDQGSFDNGWVMPEPPNSALQPYVPVTRDQGVATRAKRHAVKGHRGWGNNPESDQRKATRGEAEKHQTSQSPVSDASLTDYPSTSKENHGVGDRPSSHWLPKSSIPQQGNRPDIGQNVGAENNSRGERKDSSSQGRTPFPPQPRNQNSEGTTKYSSVSQKGNVGEAMEIRHQDNRRERRAGPVKERPRSANQDAGVSTEPPLETRTQQRMPGGPRRNNGNQTHHSGRGQESHGDWGSSSHQHNFPPKQDRQRHNSHYEYKPVGPQSSSNRGGGGANNPEGPKDDSHYTGTKLRERGHSHSRRGGGNFHG